MSTTHVRLLGGFALVRRREEATPPLSPRRPEAVLAVLAVCGDLGCTRDRLIGLLWPDRDGATARHALRDALYTLRRSLGREAIPGTGDLLRLDPAVVTSDVREFEEALEDERLADAVAVYGGPLLDGFHLSDAPAFERWLEAERARLCRERQRAVKALARGAEEEGRWDEAAGWWARAVAADPYDSRLVERRMVSLARAGDRANAVLEGEAHARRLRSELELEPDGAFLDRLESIRGGEPVRARRAVDPDDGTAGALAGEAPTRGRAEPDAAGDGPGSPRPRTRGRRPGEVGGGGVRRGVLVVAALVAAVAVALFAARLGRDGSSPGVVDPVQVTTATGVERSPSWSPDGRALAYQSDPDGDSDIWVAQPGVGDPVNRTPDHDGDDLHPRWSPDGRWISFFSDREGGGYFLMPAVGGTPRKVAPWQAGGRYPTPAEWSPDGSRLAYALGQREEPWIRILPLRGGEPRRLRLPRRPRNRTLADLSWSPDGRFLAYERSISPFAATGELWLTDVDSGESVRLTDGAYRDASPTWSPDSRQLFFVSDRSGAPDLWRLSIDTDGAPEGRPTPVTAGMELTAAALSPDGRRIAYTKGRRVHNVYRAPILPDRPATWAHVTQLTFDEADFESIAVDPRGRLLLSSDRSGNWDIFIMPAGGGPLRQLTTDSALDAGPSWGPDGEGMVFYSSRTGHRQVWLMSLEDREPQQLTYGPEEKLYPTFSPDGREIAVRGMGVPVYSVEDGSKRLLADSILGNHPDWSPDGRHVVFSGARDGVPGLWLVPARGGEAGRLTRLPGNSPRWSPDGDEVFFLGHDRHRIHAVSVGTREIRPVTVLTGRPGHLGDIGLAVDSQFVYFTWRESRGDLWVAELRPEE